MWRHVLAGVQRRERVLEDDLHFLSQMPHLARIISEDTLALKKNVAARGLLQPQDEPSQGGLTASGLAHQAKCLARLDDKADPINRLDGRNLPKKHSAGDREVLDQIPDLNKRS